MSHHQIICRTRLSLATRLAMLLIACCFVTVNAQEQDAPKAWRALFNGKNIDDWTVKINHHDVGANYGNTFRVKDGILQVRYDEYGDQFNKQFGHLFFDEPFSYYHIVVEYRFVGEMYPGSPGFAVRNSGVMFHSQSPYTMQKDQDWPICVELQLLGGLSDGKPRPTGNMCSPGTDVVYQGKIADEHCINSSSKTYDGDVWVRAEAIVLGDSLITHIVEGDTVLTYSKPQIGGGDINNYDPLLWEPDTLLSKGYIALQSEGQPVDFRKVELLVLEGCTDPKAANYKDYYVKSDPSACVYLETTKK